MRSDESMSIRYAPSALSRIKEYQADLRLRVQAGVLTREESVTLLSQRMREEAAGAEPHKVRCPDCTAIHGPFVGVGQTFTCPCSPDTARSVWDCRLP